MTSVQKEFVSEILKAGYVMLDLVNDVLDLEKIESGKLSLDMGKVPWDHF